MITKENLDKKFKLTLIIEIVLAIIAIYLMFIYKPHYSNKFRKEKFNVQIPVITSNTTRVYGKDFYETAVSISQLSYTATFNDNRPNGIILVRGDKKEEAILSARLMHDPINAPILYIDKDMVPKVTMDEIKRLKPKGIKVDGNKKIILIGDVGDAIEEELNKNNFKFRHIIGKNVFDLGKKIDDYCAAIKGNHKDIVMTVPIDMADYALAETAWCAYSGDPILFINRENVPKETSESLDLRHGGSYMYMLGNEKLVSTNVKDELLKKGYIQNIHLGNNLYSQAVGFASFRDVGKNAAWWINKNPRHFGWGISEAGHNFIFANPNEWQSTIAAAGLSYKGKFGPMILVENNKISDEVIKYLQVVKPMKTSPKGQIYNHGWIIGSENEIKPNIQAQLDKLLEYGEVE
ncbi:cell wall-binding repeat-containing protein [Clostridium botulinum]|nr:cell wall-binding repeat-containing protein [Clostridium botulinum]